MKPKKRFEMFAILETRFRFRVAPFFSVYTTAVDLHFIITNLIDKLRQKRSDKYYGNNIRLALNQLKEIDETKREELMSEFD